MNTSSRKLTCLTWLTSIISLLLGFSLPVHSAPGPISNIPLFLSNKAEPNIFFMLDDSGSMNADIITQESGDWGGVMQISQSGGSRHYRFLFDSSNSNSFILPTQAAIDTLFNTGNIYDGDTPSTSSQGVWRGRNSDYNTLYYNPKRTYTPWAGVNDAGVTYADISIDPAAAPIDPYLAAGSAYNLTDDATVTTRDPGGNLFTYTYTPAAYWVWNDTNSNGEVDANDSHARIVISLGTPVCADGVDTSAADQIAGACMLRSYADEIKNFATWFSYHRSRELSAKHATSHVIANANNIRMGLATINQNRTNAQIPLRSMNSSSIDPGNKRDLLTGLSQIYSNSSTPLRRALQRAGNYFACSGTRPNFGGSTSECGMQTAAVAPATEPAAQCQQNFTVLVSDGERNGSSPGVGNVDNNGNTFAGEPYADGESDTLADVAMEYYYRDLQPTIANQVPVICGVDENNAQHMVTFTVGFGVTGTLDLDNLPEHPRLGLASDCTATTGSDFAWYTGSLDSSAERIDDMVHAAFNGRGEYLSAQDPEAFASALNNTIRTISSRSGAAAAVTFNSSSLSSNTNVFIARFNSSQWSGEFTAYPLNTDGSIGTVPVWHAHDLLDSRDLATEDRAIVTYNPASDTGIAFRWGSITSAQQDDLKTNSSGGLETTAGFPVANARLDYIRGERGCEVGSLQSCSIGSKTFRPRASRLGDLIHSAPVYVEKPRARFPDSAPYPETESYSKFKTGDASASDAFESGKTADDRTPMVYIGGNDGMLHAFNAQTGEEVWGYIPNAVYASGNDEGGLHNLTESGYEHQYFVDLTPTVADAYIDIDSVGGDDWHTVLVGGLRAGGRGIFAIDVTDPDFIIEAGTAALKESRLSGKVMWEFTNADDPDLGYTFSQPTIAALGTSSSIEWYVIFGNGYSSTNTAVGSNPFSSKLYILKLEGPGIDGVWNLGTDYFKFDTRLPAGTSVAEADRNGMSSPAVADYDNDGVADRVYAGDLYGRLWAIDVIGGSNSWDFAFKSGQTPLPLFTATDGDAGAGNRQPITTKPILAFHPTVDTVASGVGANLPNLMVYFGTGQYLASGDLSDTSVQSFYGVWDKDTGSRTVNRTDPANSNNHLVRQTIVSPAAGLRINVGDEVDYEGGEYGWYVDLPTSGERVVFNPQVRSNIVFFNTLIPSQNPCDFGGSGWIMALDQASGKSPADPIFDTNNDGVVNSDDALPYNSENVAASGSYSSTSIPTDSAYLGGGSGGSGGGPPGGCKTYQYVTLSDGTQQLREVWLPCDLKLGRLSWRQLRFD